MLLAFSGLWGEDGGLWIVSRIESSLHAPCVPDLPRFILLVRFSDTLLVVSILDIAVGICGHFCISEGVNHPCFVVPLKTMGPFSPGDN